MHSILTGSCLKLLPRQNPDSFTACVTDPPYGIGAATWDHRTCVSFQPETWAAVHRVLKPGAYLLAFGMPRTYHRLAVAVEDAGFEITDCLLWLHSQGMPKTRNLFKELQRLLDREEPLSSLAIVQHLGQWQDWGTNLRPAWEPILVARKPMPSTYSRNIIEHGVAGLAIERCRIPCPPNSKGKGIRVHSRINALNDSFQDLRSVPAKQDVGRHPANVILDRSTAAMLDVHTCTSEQDLERTRYSRKAKALPYLLRKFCHDSSKMPLLGSIDGCKANPVSRFFYCAKATKRDRGAGNFHPTVKPLALIKYLVSLVTYPDQNVVLDPFCGSGTTLLAAQRLERNGVEISSVGMECERQYVRIAKRRINSKLSTGK